MKRIVCFAVSHRWAKRQYESQDRDAGHYLHCLRCGKDDHDTGRTHGHMGSVGLGGGFG